MTRLRRDPRAERAARNVPGGERPRLALPQMQALSGRNRRDPRAQALAQTIVIGRRNRIDRHGIAVGAVAPSTPAATASVLRIEAPAFLVAVVQDGSGGTLSAWDRQLLGAARILAGETGAVVLLTAADPAGAGVHGADRVIVDPGLAIPDPGLRAGALIDIIGSVEPRHTLFAETPESGDLGRRVAAATGAPFFADAEMVTSHRVARPARARRIERSREPEGLIGLALDVAADYSGIEREARRVEPIACIGGRRRAAFQSMGAITRDAQTVPLAEADFVVAAGNGVTDFESFRQLTHRLGATPGASRVVCDRGQMPRDRQVGASGTVLAGRCYLAFGIAGAPQHLQGIAKVEHVIAVNTDLHAAMVKRAGLAIVADAQRVMPALAHLIERRQSA